MQKLVSRVLSHTAAAGRSLHGDATREKLIAPHSQWLFGRSVGCYLSAQRLYLAAVRHIGPHRNIMAVESVTVPQETSAEEKVGRLGDALRKFITDHRLSRARVSAVVAGEGTAFRQFSLPAMRRSDLSSAVHLEAARQLPFPPADCHYAFAPVARLYRGRRHDISIALHAATQQVLQDASAHLEGAGSPPQAIRSATGVVGRLLSDLPDSSAERTTTVLRVGPQDCDVAFYRGARLEFCHQVSIGASTLGDISGSARLDYFVATLAGEVQTAFDYYTVHQGAATSPEVFVHGEGSSSGPLLRALSKRTGYRFVGFPLQSIGGTSFAPSVAPDAAVEALPAVAAALSRDDQMNLLPAERQVQWRRRRLDRVAGWVLAAAVAVMALASGMLDWDRQIRQMKARALEQQLAMYRSSAVYPYLGLQNDRKPVWNDYGYPDAKTPTLLALNLKELSRLTPEEIRLVRYDFNAAEKSGNLRIHGRVESPQLPPELALVDFVERLNASGFFDRVRVERHVKRKVGDRFYLDFELVLQGAV